MHARAIAAAVLLAISNTIAPSASPLEVVDSRGQMVGEVISLGIVAREISGAWVAIPVDRNGFVPGGSAFLYVTPHCSGQRFIQANGLPVRGVVDQNNLLYFPALPFINLPILSSESSSVCVQNNSHVLVVGVARSFRLNSLGLIPPFHVQ
jgi:hypothetical protein